VASSPTGTDPNSVSTRGTALRDVLKDANKLVARRHELDNLRMDYNREWAQNRAFYNNYQWIYWNGAAGRIEQFGVEDGERPRYKVRLTANQITPGVTQLIAQMTKTRPTIHAVPESGGDRDVKAAEMAERLYEFWWDEFHLNNKLQTALTHAQISQGYWLITWDPYAGKEFRVMLNPQTGQPVTDDELGDIYRDNLIQMATKQGQDPQQLLGQFQKTLYLGDINVAVLSGEMVWVDPGAMSFEDAAYVIVRFPMNVDEIEARWKVRVPPDTTQTPMRPHLQYTRARDTRSLESREVYVAFARPTPSLPKGRVVYFLEDPNQILEQKDWDFPFNELPLVKFPGMQSLNNVYDLSRVTMARPLQKELNNKVSKIAEHMNLTMRPQMLAPIGSLSQQLTDEPGLIVEYAPIQNQVPQWRPMPAIPAYAFNYVADIQQRIDRLFNLMPTERSQIPARTDSGSLVELIQEAVADQISPEIKRMEVALARAGKIMAMLAQKYYIEPRLLRVRGPNGSVQVSKFLNADLSGGFSFEPEAGTGLPRTRQGQIQQIKELVEMQVLSPQDALPYLPIGGLKSIQQKLAADEDYAFRKIEKLIKGEPLNVPQMQQAFQQAIQGGVNPETGQPFQSENDIQDYLKKAALAPVQFEDWHKSMEVIRLHMLSSEFENYDPEIQARFIEHYDQLWQTVINMPNVQAPVKTTLSLRGTVGPTVGSQILRNAGIFGANPESMKELPLDTDVRDYLGGGDKGTGEGSGNHPLEQATLIQTLMAESGKNAEMQAQAENQTALAQQRVLKAHADHGADMVSHHQQARHAEEMHQHRLAAQRELDAHKLAEAHLTTTQRLELERKKHAQQMAQQSAMAQAQQTQAGSQPGG
jgi:hypothetical protein